jgi:4a-hydroxytetrahydrobiopterin dehydratase
MSALAERELKPPRSGEPLKGSDLLALFQELGSGWELIEDHHLEKEFRFPDFQSTLDFTVRVGGLAESVDHHPEICLTWGKARITIWTHSIGGLSEADFVFAARAEQLTS